MTACKLSADKEWKQRQRIQCLMLAARLQLPYFGRTVGCSLNKRICSTSQSCLSDSQPCRHCLVASVSLWIQASYFPEHWQLR
jgi:hypothetical protein